MVEVVKYMELYFDGLVVVLCEVIGGKYGIDVDWIVCGVGFDEIF